MSKLLVSCSSKAFAVFAGCLALIVSVLAAPSTARADTADYLSRSFAAPGGGSRAEGQTKRKGSKGVQVASLGGGYESKPKLGPSLSGGGVTWVASSGCLNSTLRNAVHSIGSQHGRVVVSSTCRNHAHNRRVGGAPKSHHLTGNAVDFRVHGNYGAAYAYLRSHGGLGGVKHYGGGLFHVDTGPKRSW